jgi:hypothetical protein
VRKSRYKNDRECRVTHEGKVQRLSPFNPEQEAALVYLNFPAGALVQAAGVPPFTQRIYPKK